MKNLPRGICARCGKDVAVRRNGTVREHYGRLIAGRRTVCSGSGNPPLPNPAAVTIDLE